MGRTRYVKCVSLLTELKSENKIITLDKLKNAIRANIGDDVYRTLKPCIKLMLDLGLIKVVGDEIRIQ